MNRSSPVINTYINKIIDKQKQFHSILLNDSLSLPLSLFSFNIYQIVETITTMPPDIIYISLTSRAVLTF